MVDDAGLEFVVDFPTLGDLADAELGLAVCPVFEEGAASSEDDDFAAGVHEVLHCAVGFGEFGEHVSGPVVLGDLPEVSAKVACRVFADGLLGFFAEHLRPGFEELL